MNMNKDLFVLVRPDGTPEYDFYISTDADTIRRLAAESIYKPGEPAKVVEPPKCRLGRWLDAVFGWSEARRSREFMAEFKRRTYFTWEELEAGGWSVRALTVVEGK
jgi:hypothetical protein